MEYQNQYDKRVFAIIVTFNPEKKNLLIQHKALYFQVDGLVYVDNNSEDTTFISEISDDKTFIIINKKNEGLASAQNVAIKKAKKEGADFILLMDQDSIPSADMVGCLMDCYYYASRDFKVSAIGPNVFNTNSTSNDKMSKGVMINGIKIRRFEIEELSLVSYCISSGSLIPIQVIEEVGMMKECLFIDGIDIEWGIRANSKGYKSFQTNKTILYHSLGNGNHNIIKSHSSYREYFIVRNSIWMVRQNYVPIGYRFRRLFFSIGRILQALKQNDFEHAKSGIKGFKDGLRF